MQDSLSASFAGGRFNLGAAFVAFTLLAFLAWAASAQTEVSCGTFIALVSACGAVWGRLRWDDPVGAGALAGAIAVCLLVTCIGGLYSYLYYFNRELAYATDPDYDFDAPPGFFLLFIPMYAPGGLVIGGAVGLVVLWISDYFVRPARAERSDPPPSPLDLSSSTQPGT